MKEFDAKAQEEIGSYVYALFDSAEPLRPIYIGKGRGNRVFSHARGEIAEQSESAEEVSAKLRLIQQIQAQGRTVKHKIVRHGMSEREALEVEAALIDMLHYIQPDTLTNVVDGHGCDRGLCDARDFAVERSAKDFHADAPVMIIKIERRWTELIAEYGCGADVPQDAIYNAVRGDWIVNPDRATQARCVLAVARGLVRGVFEPTGWEQLPEGKRKRMTGGSASTAFDHYRGTSVGHMFERGGQNPIRYAGFAQDAESARDLGVE